LTFKNLQLFINLSTDGKIIQNLLKHKQVIFDTAI